MRAYSSDQFVFRALLLLGEVDAIDPLDPEDAATGYDALQEMIDDWGTQRKTILHSPRNNCPLTAGVASYTIGPGGVFNQVRPTWIDAVSVVLDRTAAQPIEIPLPKPITLEEYQRIPMKLATAQYPDRIFYDHAFSQLQLGTIKVYPVPTSSLLDLILYTPAALTGFTDQTTQYYFAPGYSRAIRYNLAIELASEYDRVPSARVERIASQSLANIKRSNFRPNEANFDPMLGGVRGRYNIYTDVP